MLIKNADLLRMSSSHACPLTETLSTYQPCSHLYELFQSSTTSIQTSPESNNTAYHRAGFGCQPMCFCLYRCRTEQLRYQKFQTAAEPKLRHYRSFGDRKLGSVSVDNRKSIITCRVEEHPMKNLKKLGRERRKTIHRTHHRLFHITKPMKE